MLAPSDRLQSIPDALEIGGTRYPRRTVEADDAWRVDLGHFFGGLSGVVARGTIAYLMREITVAQAGSYTVHAGADWWMHWWLNGDPVFTTIPAGNQSSLDPIGLDNHSFTLDLEEGTHVLAVAVIAGGAGFRFAGGGSREAQSVRRAPPAERNPFEEAFRTGMQKLRQSERQHVLVDFESAGDAFRLAAEAAQTSAELARAEKWAGYAALSNPATMDFDPVRAHFRAGLEHEDDAALRAEALVGIAEAYRMEQAYREAHAACQEVFESDAGPDMIGRAWLTTGRLLLQQRRPAEALVALEHAAQAEEMPADLLWEARALKQAIPYLPGLRSGRPRLFMTDEQWPAIQRRALNQESARFHAMRTDVEQLRPEELLSGVVDERIMEAAFVYRITGHADTLQLVRGGLEGFEESFLQTHPNRAFPWIAWAAAYDWVWSDLEPPDRRSLANDILRLAWRVYSSTAALGRTTSRATLAGWPHYYTRSMFFYMGVALLDDELDDVGYLRALTLFAVGLENHRDYFAQLIRQMGDDRVWQINVEYDFTTVPTPHFAFMHAWTPATGLPLPDEWHGIGMTPDYALRMLPGVNGEQLIHLNYAGHSGGVWGFGWMNHVYFYEYLRNYLHFFGATHPDQAAIARVLYRRNPLPEHRSCFPVLDFMLTDLDLDERDPAPPAGLPVARHYDSVGLVLMSSGFGPDDTYALFSVGGGIPLRRHDFDAAHFTIYRRGWLAMDTGVRTAEEHSANYRHQTVAHNSVLIRMPGEELPRSRSGPVSSNSGGQNRYPCSAETLAFESHAEYAYAAVDATPVYHEDKCTQMIRQFLFLPPDHFVVFDRVASTHADYPKTWLFHTANEPVMVPDAAGAYGRIFRADQGEGRVFCHTLLPKDAVLETIGGPGKEFWADGRNWPIRDVYRAGGDWWTRYGRGHRAPTEGMGRWRVDVSPGTGREEDFFLHLIQTAGPETEAMAPSRIHESDQRIHIAFSAHTRQYEIEFNKTGSVGGHIRISEEGNRLVDRPLTETIQRPRGPMSHP